MDKRIVEILEKENKRQRDTVELIASENFASQSVMDLAGSVFTNKYAEGYNSGEEYIYLLKNTGKTDYLGKNVGEWFYSDYGKPFKALEEDAINDHIAMLKRHLEMMKERKAA